MSAESALLRAQGIGKRLRDGAGEQVILRDVSLSVAAREWVALMGRSGSGKSTLLHILGALDADYQGEVEILGQKLGSLDDAGRAELRGARIGFVFQAYNLLSHLTALENVLLPSRFSGPPADLARAEEALAEVGLTGKGHRRPNQLSGGERQRVAIARALYLRPSLVLCDEPTGNLDAATGQEILELFARLRDRGAALLIATHDEGIAARADRIVRLDRGVLQ